MKVIVELAPKDWWFLAAKAEASALTLPDFIRSLLVDPETPTHARVRRMWSDGLCDAEVANAMGMTPASVKNVRLAMGLPANKRFKKRAV